MSNIIIESYLVNSYGSNTDHLESLQEWLLTKSERVQKLHKEFPIGTTYILDNTIYYQLGYTEDDMLIISPVDPVLGYYEAINRKIYVCANHFR